MKLVGGVKRAGVLTGAVALLMGLTSGVTAGASTSSPGVTAHTILIGVISPVTGPGAPEYKYIIPAVEARFDLQNAEGGVDGRKLKIVSEDTESSAAQNATASQALLSKNVFGVIDETPLVVGGYRIFQQAGVPVTGGGTGQPVFSTEPDTNMFAFDQLAPGYPANTTIPNFFKKLGVTKIASFGYDTPSASAAAKSNAVASEKAGLDNCYLNTSIPFGSVDAAPIALSLKNAGCDGMVLDMDNNTNFAILTAATQAGVKIKAAVAATGYGQTLLTTAAAAQSGQGVYFSPTGVPVELHTPATEAFQAALKKYDNFTGIPAYSQYSGYMAAALMIKGLEVAGKNPTRASFISNLRKVTKWTATGLDLYPANFTLGTAHGFGKSPVEECSYFMKLTGSKYLPTPSTGKVTCGKTIPGTTQASKTA